MSTNKVDVIGIGPGGLAPGDTAATCRIFSSTFQMDVFAAGATYPLRACAEYGGKIYRSLQAGNVGNQPDISPTFWEVLLSTVHDGDMCIVCNGASSDHNIRIGGQWVSLPPQPKLLTLVDGQLTSAAIFTYSATEFPYAKIEYTIRRGTGHGRKRKCVLTVLTDGIATITTSEDYEEIGSDVNVPITVSIGTGTISINYTSVLEGSGVEFGYILKGWK